MMSTNDGWHSIFHSSSKTREPSPTDSRNSHLQKHTVNGWSDPYEESIGDRKAMWKRLSRRALTEVVGTFILVFVHSGLALQYSLNPDTLNNTGVAIAQGATVMGLIYAFGQVSGAHFNPCVTLAFALRRDIQWRLVPLYWCAEFLGAVLAGLALLGFFGNVHDLGGNIPLGDTTPMKAMLFEMVLTFILVSVILATANRGHVLGPHAAIAVGGTATYLIFFGRAIGTGSMNPARSFGPALWAGGEAWRMLWVFTAGPVAGAILATGFIYLIASHKNINEERAAALGYGRADVSWQEEVGGAQV